MTAMEKIKKLFRRRPHVAVIRLDGAIGMGRRGLSDAGMAATIERAFKSKPAAVALAINSPGGSPVQSSLIAGRIRRLADEKEIPVIAFVEDVAASGGYWLASAADEIHADAASILGSIGVISAGFGLSDAIARHGIERRVHTAGKSKSFLDPFRPENPEDVARLKKTLDEMHEIFIAQVKSRRPALSEEEDLFSGEIWLGQRAVELGLADGIAHLGPEMRRRFGEKIRFRRFGKRRGMLSRLGANLIEDAGAAIDERAAFARFGL